MGNTKKEQATLTFPGDVDYIPAIRKFVAEFIEVSGFSPKFAYRTEIIIDELCSNAISYGCTSTDSTIRLTCTIEDGKVELIVQDPGGEQTDIDRLHKIVKEKTTTGNVDSKKKKRLGLEIVRMLSEKLDFQIDTDNITSVRVTRKREDDSKINDNIIIS
jgi:anti-sigma regulatory factor (Ser/Thr protein kinase)